MPNPYTLEDVGGVPGGTILRGFLGRNFSDSGYIQNSAGPVFDVYAFGAQGDGVTDDKAAIDTAIAFAQGWRGGTVLIGPGQYVCSGNVQVPRTVRIAGCGVYTTTINHTGNNSCFVFEGKDTVNGYSDDDTRQGIESLTITGNTGASAVAIEVKNTQHFRIRDVNVGHLLNAKRYTNGVSLLIHNDTYWNENLLIENFGSRYSAVGIRYLRDGAGAASFGYHRWHKVSMNVPANGIGWDVGGASASTVNVYSGEFNANYWLEGNNAIAINIPAVGQITRSNSVFFQVEPIGGSTGTVALKNRGIYRPNGILSADYGSPTATIDSLGAVDTKVNTLIMGDVLGSDNTPAPWIGCAAGSPNGSISAPIGSVFFRRDAGGAVATMFVKGSGTGNTGWVAVPAPNVIQPTYGASITVNAHNGDCFFITATNGSAFTINNPPFAIDAGRRIVFDILNSSGGAMGAITWGANYKLAGAFTNPANTKRRTIEFYTPDGTNFVEVGRAVADI